MTVASGKSVTFNVTAAGTAPFTYQWRKDGVAIAGATTSSYMIAGVATANSGVYTAVVANSAGSVVSDTATLTVNAPTDIVELTPASYSARGEDSAAAGVAMLFDGNLNTKWLDNSPAASTWVMVNFSSPTVLSAYSLTSGNDVPYRDPASWTLSGSNDGITWTTIETRSGQSWATRLLTRDFVLATPSTAYTRFRFDFTPTVGSATQLTEIDLYGPGAGVTVPSISTQPVSRTVTEGSAATFSVVASGSSLSYQWRKNGTAISGATTASYTLAATALADAGNYTVVVSNPAGSVTSSTAVLTVSPLVIAPAITTQPVSRTVTEGQSASFSVVASGTSPAYQWRKNGVGISGATGSTYTISATTSTDAASYSVVVSNSAGSVTSSAASLTVNPLIIAPAITLQPVSQTITEGGSANFYVVASGTSPSYQWLKNGAAILGATNSSLTLSPAALSDAATYTVFVSNSAGSVTSSAAVLTVNPLVIAPSITTQPASQTVTETNPVTFTVVASGTSPSFQWRKNGTNISGATGSTYTIASTALADAASYSVVVSNSAGSVTSNAATLTVNSASGFTELTPNSYSARGEDSVNANVGMLFDHDLNSKWLDYSATTWVKVVFNAPTVLDAYSLTSANDVPYRDPASWTLSGSNDGVTWTVIESRSGQSWASRFLARDFVLAQRSAAYTQFRFDFVPTVGSATQLAEIELYGATQQVSVQLTPSTYSARGQANKTYAIAKLFDGANSTKWLDNSGTSWVRVSMNAASSLHSYTLTSAADYAQYDPVSWTLLGSNDGTTWTTIETRSAEAWSSRGLKREFKLATASAKYVWFRFDFKTASGITKTHLAEAQFFGAQ